MSMADGATTAPAEAGSLPASQLPWQQIPTFDPQTTDLQVYSRKLQFLKDIWPVEHIGQLAPRAALQVQGVAFQKVARLDTAKLRSEAGVKYLVEALGGQWGKLASEEKLSYFERAFYLTSQRSDESNDSYLARHDAAFEDMTAAGVTMEEVRAYVLIRQSQLPADDRKRLVVETQGNLSYEGARKSLRLLGSKFFQDLQGGSKTNKYRTYDVNSTEVHDETAMMTSDMEMIDEDALVQYLHENGDEDAAFIMDFEETVIETLQDSPELASCYHTYMEARTRLKERAKFRGFWATAGATKGKGKKGKGSFGKGSQARPKSLAEKIATSACRRCGAVGHWKRECPLAGGKGDSKGKGPAPETITLAEALITNEEINHSHLIEEMPMTLPADAMDLGLETGGSRDEEIVFMGEIFNDPQNCFKYATESQATKDWTESPKLFNQSVRTLMAKNFDFKKGVKHKIHHDVSSQLQENLLRCCRKHGLGKFMDTTAVTSPPEKPDPTDQKGSAQQFAGVFLSHEEKAGEAVIDTGASRSVIGEDRLKGLADYVLEKTGCPLKKVASNVQFRFGNSGTLQSRYAVCIPRQQKGWIRVEVVPGRTPFLISNTVLKEMGTLIDPRNQQIRFLEESGLKQEFYWSQLQI